MLSQRDTLGKYNADVLFLIVISTKHDALTFMKLCSKRFASGEES
jgi:hypothetical protein